MSIKPRTMTVVFDDREEIRHISTLFCYYMSAVDQPTQTNFGIEPPVIKMFGIDYRVTHIDSDSETIGYKPTLLNDYALHGRVVKPTLTVTLERVES